jgi:hypothetical protein
LSSTKNPFSLFLVFRAALFSIIVMAGRFLGSLLLLRFFDMGFAPET